MGYKGATGCYVAAYSPRSMIKKGGAADRLATKRTMVTFTDKRLDDRGWISRDHRPRLVAGYAQGYI
jgi:hypothetical protein